MGAALASELFLSYLGPGMKHFTTQHWAVFLVSAIACVVESVPLQHYDNLTVGVSAAVTGYLLL